MKNILILFLFVLISCGCSENGDSEKIIESDAPIITDTSTDTTTDVPDDTVPAGDDTADTSSDSSGDTDTTPPDTRTPDQVIDTTTDTDPTSDSPPVVIPEFTPNIIIITDSEAYLSDGDSMELFLSGSVKYVDRRLLSVDNQLVEYDPTADVRMVFDQVPAQVLDNGSVYHCIEIDPDTALSMGAQAKWYSEFFKDGISLGFWYLNQMRCTDLISVGEIVWNIDENGQSHVIDGAASDVEFIHEKEFYIHSADAINQTISFNDLAPQDYVRNYIFAADQWQYFDGLWYSENGYTWSEVSGLSEAVNILDGWNEAPFLIALPMAQYPRLVSAGVNDGLLYWIERNTGWLISFDPAMDEINQVNRLYLGDGMTATGESKDLRPVMVWPHLYYFDQGWYQLDMLTGFTSLFYAGEATINKW